jgi:hypothetical protein
LRKEIGNGQIIRIIDTSFIASCYEIPAVYEPREMRR